MNCPDSQHVLIERVRGGITTDQCPYCGGVWFDAGELESIQDSRKHGFTGGRAREVEFRVEPGRAKRLCPRCREASLQFGVLGMKRVDRCARCLGLWVPHTPAAGLSGASGVTTYDEGVLGEILGGAFELVFAVIEVTAEILS